MMAGMTSPAARADVRRTVLTVTIASFGIAALLGISVLLGADAFGDTGLRILATTVVVACGSVVTLCCLAAVGGRYDLVGVLGFLLTLATTALGVLLVWGGDSSDLANNLGDTFLIAITASLTTAQVCLMLATAGGRPRLAPVLWTTVLLAALVAVMVSELIVGHDASDGYVRLLGVVGILDVLGTLVTIAVGAFGRDPEALTVTVDPDIAAQVRERALMTGRPVWSLVDEAVARYLDVSVE
jgi:hypothetical protein